MPGLGRKRKRNWLIGASLLLPVAGDSWPSGAAAPVAGASPTAFTIAPSVHYHPNSQSVSVNGSNAVLDCPDIRGLARLTGIAAVAANKLRNPNMAGAVAGTPGTLPTNWSIGGAAGLTTSVVSSGVQSGLAYVDVRFVGTTSGTFATVLMDAAGIIAASNGQAWTGSATVSVVGGSLSNITSSALTTNVLDGASAVLQQLSTNISPTGTATRFSNSGTISNASAAFVRPLIGLNYSSGVAIDVTLRIAYPMLEQASAASALQAIGPVQMTDALGRKFWRFSPNQYLLIANTLTAINSRQCAVFALWRQHRVSRGMDQPLFSTRYSAYTDDTTNTARSNGYILRTNSATGALTSDVPRLKSGTTDSFAGHANSPKMIPGAQIHVAGFVSRAGASAGTDVGGRFYMNTDAVPTAQSSLTGTADVGAIIGGKATGTNGVTGTGDTWFDLYELVFWKGTLTDAQADAIAAAMVANWAIPTITAQLILSGDSITYGTVGSGSNLVPADTLGVQLTEPGAELIPPNYRVLNVAIPDSSLVTYSGQTGCLLTHQRDNAAGPFTYTYPGGAANNIIAPNIGINDMKAGNGNVDAATHYTNFVALLNTTTTGYLQRGFKVVAVTPTAFGGDSTGLGRLLAFRDLIINPTTDVVVSQFLTDCQANTGQAYDGLVSVLPIAKITYGASGTLFQSSADAADATYYATDLTHLQGLGSRLLATGADTPQYGYGSIL